MEEKSTPENLSSLSQMGDEAFYDFLHDNIAIESHPVNYVNDPGRDCPQNDNVVSV